MRLKVIYLIILAKFVTKVDLKLIDEYNNLKQEQVEVRAVFVNCEPNEEQNDLESEATRFQREELFKHSALQGCRKKLALTVKMTSEPDKTSGDEYIPIEHVFDGSNKRRARLLDPYILRVRRDPPVQAYKLHRIDTVSGILTKSSDRGTSKIKKNRITRNLDELAEVKERRHHLVNTESEVEEKLNSDQCLVPKNASNVSSHITSQASIKEGYSKININEDNSKHNRVKRNGCTFGNNPAWKRDKRHEHNIIVEDIVDDYKVPWETKDRFYRRLEHLSSSTSDLDKKSTSHKVEDILKPSQISESEPYNYKHRALHIMQKDHHHQASPKREQVEGRLNLNDDILNTKLRDKHLVDHTTRKNPNSKKDKKNTNEQTLPDSPEKKFVLYDIGNPDLWYTVHVQLFEKMSTSEGKTVWNDITKGEVASVSSVQPEWMDQDLNVRYKPTEWMSKNDFTLPASTDLCLLVPISEEGSADTNDEVITDLNTVGKYIVVHKDDIVDVGVKNTLSKRDGNYSDFTDIPKPDNLNPQSHRRVLVRVSRALLTGHEEDLGVSLLGSDYFLTLPHRRPHHAQIDVEARADGNQLIRVGSSGSIITVVSDNSRRTRSVITIQTTNKGLAAARFRVIARDCGLEMASILSQKEDELIAGPVLLAPRHTQRFQIELPTELPVDKVHCSVALINDDDESVAVRDVAIKKGDRCFCVWHCDCVCSNEDPKLPCREMAEARQVAAGLSPRERPRQARSVCYGDVVTVNLFVMIIGVIIVLLLLGLVKASLGLVFGCVAKWGLNRLIQMPRKLNHYYEPALNGRSVVYDDEGWPVHPDTMKRNVRLISRQMEFILNVLFFIMMPCLLLCDAVKKILCRHTQRCGSVPEDKDHTHDMQGLQRLQQQWHRRRGRPRLWMTPQAQDLSTDIWSKGLPTGTSIGSKCESMRPLLLERHRTAGEPASSCVDSEQDDTEYVLMQMQKSKESLAKSQKKLNESGTSSATARKQSQNVTRQN